VESMMKLFIRSRESVVRNTRGQTMTEYALIIASVGVISWTAYKAMGANIGSRILFGVEGSPGENTRETTVPKRKKGRAR
jgi:Flp pilus assembly pilin Flp